jgi:hypothetical protein
MYETRRATTEPQRTQRKIQEAEFTACQFRSKRDPCETTCLTCPFFTLCASVVNNPGFAGREQLPFQRRGPAKILGLAAKAKHGLVVEDQQAAGGGVASREEMDHSISAEVKNRGDGRTDAA